MDNTIRNSTAGRFEAANDAGHNPAASRDRAEQTAESIFRVQGACIRCHEQTGCIVIFASKPEFLCPDCGVAIREAA